MFNANAAAKDLTTSLSLELSPDKTEMQGGATLDRSNQLAIDMLEISSLRQDQARFREGLDLLRDDLEALKHDTRTRDEKQLKR